MSYIEEMLEFNKKFVEGKQYENFPRTKLPNKKIAVLTCMDTRLVELLPAALNFKNSDIKVIKNAGALVLHPFGSVMRSLLIAVYALGVHDIFVISHYDCGVQGMEASKIMSKMHERGIDEEKIDFISQCGIDLDKWFKGFDSVETSVHETVNIIKHHPLIPADVKVYGFIMDPETGRLDTLEN
jgi:carbonic anhydrase